MLERFIEQTHFTSQEDFIKNLRIKVPDRFFNFGYDVVDAWAAEQPYEKLYYGRTTRENTSSLLLPT